ncbi:hypothetical protein HJFPF1_00989 [Paramyrothecium foliicola]|nr:hypothetical protein HJFPF1_00989 [Paramyrothecium foliicola]
MAAAYKQFLVAPSSSLLSDRATLHYVTTAISFNGPTEIIKHLNALQRQVIKKKETILNVVDGQNAIAIEVDTGLEFQTSGGSYCPGLDDNFLSDRLVQIPMVHFVTFDADGKISQVRIQWDQGSVLKQLEVIGKTGRNWPIKDGREQILAIQSSLKAGGISQTTDDQKEMLIRTRGNSTNVMRDPHASLHRQPTREEIEAEIAAPVVSPYGGNRPQQRSFADLLGDEPLEAGSPTAHRQRSDSPSKGGQGKNFQPMRLFEGQEHVEEEDESPRGKAGNQFIRPNPKKYQHFDFADGSDAQDSSQRGPSFDERPKSKHDSQWSFDDFVTPAKPKASRTMRAQDVRHWDTDKDALGETPAQPPVKARRDAEAHFELQDDGERDPQLNRPAVRPRGTTHNEGLGLYKNKLFDRDDASAATQQPLGNITNLKDRGKDFEAHFAMTDDSPSNAQPRSQHLPEGRAKAVKMMDSNWSISDDSPVSQKENKPQSGSGSDHARIHIAGDGMGSRKGVSHAEENTRIHIAGDGMGGKKGTNRDWLYGGGDEEAAPEPTRKANQAAAKKSFWDY